MQRFEPGCICSTCIALGLTVRVADTTTRRYRTAGIPIPSPHRWMGGRPDETMVLEIGERANKRLTTGVQGGRG